MARGKISLVQTHPRTKGIRGISESAHGKHAQDEVQSSPPSTILIALSVQNNSTSTLDLTSMDTCHVHRHLHHPYLSPALKSLPHPPPSPSLCCPSPANPYNPHDHESTAFLCVSECVWERWWGFKEFGDLILWVEKKLELAFVTKGKGCANGITSQLVYFHDLPYKGS